MRRHRYFFILIIFLIAFGSIAEYAAFSFRSAWRKAVVQSAHSSLLATKLVGQKAGSQSHSGQEDISLLFVGDIMLSRGVAYQIEKHADQRYPFLLVASTTRAADFAFGNLEGPISNRGINQGSIYSFRDDPKTVQGLAFAGFDALSVANNHILDWGADALTDTINILNEHGIVAVGAGGNYEEANDPKIFKINGTTIAFLAYTTLLPKSLEASGEYPGVSSFDLGRIKKEIQNLKQTQTAQIIIVSLHWGEEYDATVNDTRRAIAHALVDYGADLVVGHHPHVVEEVEHYKSGWIAYSLGNFVFDQNFSPETMRGLAITADLHEGGIVGIRSRALRISSTFQAYFE